MLEKLVTSLETCPMVQRNGYNYFIHPISDGVPIVEPELLREIGCAMVKMLDLDKVDKIVVAEAMGIHIGTVLSLMTGIPMNIVRKREYKLPGEVAVHQTTGYSKGELYLNGLFAGDRVVIIDDVISTGGTARALLSALGQIGVDVVDICVVIQRGNPDIGRDYKSLTKIEVNERVHVIDKHC
ncbi:hypoxanthine/guanine phosphoribosyltransferase [Methanosphaerula palustris]|uniref:Hypoxanthine/guanine phosphoribosyltransferase n=1 Tax=Methanosphaerula palustris (strain ATCC BAA-1556 / DSM 19958 / E1-9c) TaxID=521011 RepID=HPRT_METPE|nr:hypoxanthine/guanine phosphoribosyltransferase [Methanosphaerula palustris]B8GDM8.1 RecName: Full=Hypoxanthine/guanine phosphoribosyltransferase; Short=HGPRTase [Methanosphaerula palustris E1-9c]ACL17379.1 phosphoribosyltransferase [Methanosphaerula palustris E1-9c]